MIISGPIVISCGIIYILWLFNPIALAGMIAFLSFYPCQVNITHILHISINKAIFVYYNILVLHLSRDWLLPLEIGKYYGCSSATYE